ncbi:hypothetical protein EPO15_18345, partial [bacterium]
MFTPRWGRALAVGCAILIPLLISTPSAAQSLLSSTSFNNGVSNALGIAVSTAGPLYLTGSVDGGTSQVWTARYTPGLVFQSSHVLTTPDIAQGWAVASGNGKVYVVGHVNTGGGGASDALVMRLSPSLALEATAAFRGTGGAAVSNVAYWTLVDPAGPVYVVGYLGQTLTSSDAWIAKLDPDLALLSSATFNSAGAATDSFYGIARASDGDLYAVGTLSAGGEKIWVARFDSSLVLKASATISGSAGCGYAAQGLAVALDAGGAVYVAGELCDSNARLAATLAKFSHELAPLASVRQHGASGDAQATSVSVDADGHVFAGGSQLDGGGVRDQWLAEYTPDLALRSSRTVDGGTDPRVSALAAFPAPSSGTYAAGTNGNTLAGNAWLGRLEAAPEGPLMFAGPFASVSTGGLSVSWTSAFPPATLYYAQLSTNASFAAPLTSSNTLGLSATFSGLSANSTYYAQVATAPAGPFTSLGSTVTWMQAPTSVYFDEVTTFSVVASAYSPTPAFSNLNVGLSGTNVARDGVYAGWHGEAWTTKASMGTARYFLAGAALDGRIYALGGYTTTPSTVNEVYDPAANAWTTKTAMPTGRNSLAAATLGGLVCAIGGSIPAGDTGVNQCYDPGTNAWTSKASLSPARNGTAFAVLDGLFYSVGGSSSGYMTSTDRYSIADNVWASATALPAARASAMAAVSNGRLFVFGGYATGGALSVNTYSFDAGSGLWSSRTPLSMARDSAAASPLGGKIYVTGGNNTGSLSLNEEYDPAGDTWTVRVPMPGARTGMGSAVVGGRIYLFGGSNGVRLATTEEYDPGVARQFAGLQPNTLYTFKAKARNLAGIETGETA